MIDWEYKRKEKADIQLFLGILGLLFAGLICGFGLVGGFTQEQNAFGTYVCVSAIKVSVDTIGAEPCGGENQLCCKYRFGDIVISDEQNYRKCVEYEKNF